MFRSILPLLFLIPISIVSHLAQHAAAQATPESAALIRPYLEPTTGIVAHFQVGQTQQSWQWLAKQLQAVPPVLAPIANLLEKTKLDALTNAGVQDVYATVALQDIVQGNLALFMPTTNLEATQTLATELVQSVGAARFQIIAKPKLVIIASQSTRLRQIDSPARTNDKLPASLVGCFDSVAAQPLAIGVTLTKRMRTEVSNMWPDQLPIALPVALSPKQVLFDSQHVVLGFVYQPAPKLTGEIRSDTSVPASAQRNQKLAETLATSLEPLLGKLETTKVDSTIRLSVNQAGLETALRPLTESAQRQISASTISNRMKTIILAFHNFHEAYNFMPPRETRAANDQPLLSWRVHILPFLDQKALYDQFHLDEPWDSPHNLQLVSKMPDVYRFEADGVDAGKTRFVLPMIEGAAWFGDGPPVSFSDITDGTSNTLAVYVTQPANAVTWTKPEEPVLASDKLIEQIFGQQETTVAARFDSSVQTISSKIDLGELKALLTHQGGEVISN